MAASSITSAKNNLYLGGGVWWPLGRARGGETDSLRLLSRVSELTTSSEVS